MNEEEQGLDGFDAGTNRKSSKGDGMVKSTAKGAAKGAAKEGGKEAAKEGIKGGVDGAKKGAQIGAKIGGAIPYAGAVLGPVFGALGGVAGAGVGGAAGAAKGAAKGATKGATEGAKEGAEKAAQNRKGNSLRKGVGSLWDNIKGAFRGNKKDIFVLKIKGTLIAVVAVIAFFALIVEAVAEDTSEKSRNAMDESIKAIETAGETEGTKLYKQTGSLIFATDDELKKISDAFFKSIENTNEAYHDALSKKYSGGDIKTVANSIINITTNFESKETDKVEKISNSVSKVSGAVLPSDSRKIYDHILRTEKYNFNSIVWRSFKYDRKNAKLTKDNISFSVKDGLKYPTIDKNAIEGSTYDLKFFVDKTRPYLQTWYIPFDIMIGTEDAQSSGVLNTNLAYEIITSAYHEIVMDRYKLEEKTKTTNYLVYDEKTTTTITNRVCRKYKAADTVEVLRKAGEKCDKADYLAGLCKDAVVQWEPSDPRSPYKVVNCWDWQGRPYQTKPECTYGTIRSNITNTKSGDEKTYCVDVKQTPTVTTKTDIREEKTKPNDVNRYRWNYVISSAKLFDKVFSNEYEFEAYNANDHYDEYINKKGSYKNMTTEQYKDSEENSAEADMFSHKIADYHKKFPTDKKTKNTIKKAATESKLIDSFASVPAGYSFVEEVDNFQVLEEIDVERINGHEYTDTYKWSDKLNYTDSKNGIYNVESVKDVTGDDLSPDENGYYNRIYSTQELNLIDIMNSYDGEYKNYISKRNASSENIGIRRGFLDISYNVLKADLRKQIETYNSTGIIYGSSLGISATGSNMVAGMDLSSIVAAGDANALILAIADSHMGQSLSTFRSSSFEDYGAFPCSTHWCAMFASYCVRKAEAELGIKIPMPNFTSCTSFWTSHIKNGTNPGFYDVNTGISDRMGNAVKALEDIQPGDVLLFTWPGDWGRSHAAIAKEVEKDASGKVTKIVSINGNWGGGGYNSSTVKLMTHTHSDGSYGLSRLTSFVSISTLIGNTPGGNVE